MSTYRERFEEEIGRIGITDISETLGIARNTVYNWLAKGNVPLNYLVGLWANWGVDVTYVVCGVRSKEALTTDETVLINLYRPATAAVKAAAIGALQSGNNSQSKIHIGGKVQGQVVEGGMVNNAPIHFGSKNKTKK